MKFSQEIVRFVQKLLNGNASSLPCILTCDLRLSTNHCSQLPFLSNELVTSPIVGSMSNHVIPNFWAMDSLFLSQCLIPLFRRLLTTYNIRIVRVIVLVDVVPFELLFLFGALSLLLRHFQQVLVARHAAAILWRTRTLAVHECDAVLSPFLVGTDADHADFMPPAVAEIVFECHFVLLGLQQIRKRVVGIEFHVAAETHVHTLLVAVERVVVHEMEQMHILPAHDVNQEMPEEVELHVGGDLQLAPDIDADVVELDAQMILC